MASLTFINDYKDPIAFKVTEILTLIMRFMFLPLIIFFR